MQNCGVGFADDFYFRADDIRPYCILAAANSYVILSIAKRFIMIMIAGGNHTFAYALASRRIYAL